MSAALATAPLLARLRSAGAEVVLREQRPVVQHASRVPPELLAEARARRDDLAAELRAEADDEAAFIAAERAAIIAEGEHGNPAVPHDMPVSWADPTIQPTPGARCRCCSKSTWWGDNLGWRCWRCHPPLGARDVRRIET
ncbi:MAG: hypothetical protein B7Z67_14240 [Acidiphilium sp. 21-60-14]|nr:MAG: hypothetical protein B7Z67_14240 [Acidiphilium sp. 21-60-14]HQT74093.1 hypothetical protein [Acidiphilium sp.]